MANNLIRTIEQIEILNPNVLYVSPTNPQFVGDISFSVHLQINGFTEVPLEYNTTYDETCEPGNEGPPLCGTDGYGEPLKDITVTLYRKPPKTNIIGPAKPKLNTTKVWKINPDYDTSNEYQYDWVIKPLGNQTPPATIVNKRNKEVDINIHARGMMWLEAHISKPTGDNPDCTVGQCCTTIIRTIQEVGIAPGSILVNRNRLT